MKIGTMFPSKYVSAADITQPVTVTMSTVEMVDIGQDGKQEVKHVLHFVGASKGMILNVTNANRIAEIHGDDTDHWPGKQITLEKARVDFRGKIVDALRVQAPGVITTPQPEPVAAPMPGSNEPFPTDPPTGEVVPGDPLAGNKITW